MPRGVLVAGTRSGCGKTTLTLALLAALRRRGLTVQAGKSGPDFIDPTYHALFTGRPSYNLDSWMGGEAGMLRVYRRLLTPPVPDCLVVEGAMGLFDGARGLGGPGSAAHTARILGLPVLLAADVRGMGQSAAALALGYTRLLPDLAFAGVVCTHVASPAHANLLREAFQTANLPLLGLLTCDVPSLPSRHLGLYMAEESGWTQSTQEHLALWLENHMDLDTLLQRLPEVTTPGTVLAGTPARRPSPCPPASPDTLPQTAHRYPSDSIKTRCLSVPTAPPAPVRLAVARDEAFCFLYADMPDCLRELGVESVFFSPLRERALPPDCAGLYFPGGYPELYARDLSANRAMLQAVRAFAAAGGCIYGECGGYIYLMESLEADGVCYRMTGCLPRRCRMEARRTALGYREVLPAFPGPFGYGDGAVSGSPLAPPCFLKKKAVPSLPPVTATGDSPPLQAWQPLAPGMEKTAEARIFPRSGRGHEYHYARLLPDPDAPPLPPLWHLRDRKGTPLPDDGVIHGTVAASWVHLYPEGARELLCCWTQTLRNSTVYTASAPPGTPG